MNSKIQLQKNAAVLAADGHPIGSLNRVVVDPASKALNAIVVRVGALFNREEKVVPIKLVAEATEDHIVLTGNVGDLDAFPPLEEQVVTDENELAHRPTPTGVPPLTTDGHPDAGMPAIRTAPVGGMVTQTKQNIPDGTIAMDENPKIITLEGIQVGTVERILADPTDDHVTGLLISNGLFVKEKKLIPIQWVTDMGIEHIHLCVKKALVEELTDISRVE
jgi:uncharacterized protein YrrD